MLTTLFDRLESWHSKRFVSPWLGPLKTKRTLALAALLLALVATFANGKVRYEQGQIWKANPHITEIAGAMSFSTTDAPYFLARAAAAKLKTEPYIFDSKRSFPNNQNYFSSNSEKRKTSKHPLLSKLIAATSPTANPKDLLRAGHTLLIFNSWLTVLMIIVAFGAVG